MASNKRLYFRVKSSSGKETMQVEVMLVSKEQAFGRTICEISPVTGTGSIKVNESTLVIK